MYKAVPKIYHLLYEVINAEFGSDERGYLSTFEKECLPRRGTDLIDDLFPWGYLTISKLGRRLTEGTFYRSGRNAWYQATVSMSIIGMSKDGDIAKLIANPDFDGDATLEAPGLADIAGDVMQYMYFNHQPAAFLEEDKYEIANWFADGVAPGDNAIIRKAAPEAEYNNLAEYLAAWRVDFTFDIIERF